MDIEPLFQAIDERIKDDPLGIMREVGNRYYRERAPQTPTYPYMVYHVVGYSLINTFNYDSRLEDVTVQFTIFDKSTSSEQVNEIFKVLTNKFDRAGLTLSTNSNFQCIRCLRQMSTLMCDSSTQETVWIYSITYLITICAL